MTRSTKTKRIRKGVFNIRQADGSIKTVKRKYEVGKHNGTTDVHMIKREVYNKGSNTVTFFTQLQGYDHLVLKPQEFGILPHAYFMIETDNAKPAELVFNYGDNIGKGITVGERL